MPYKIGIDLTPKIANMNCGMVNVLIRILAAYPTSGHETEIVLFMEQNTLERYNELLSSTISCSFEDPAAYHRNISPIDILHSPFNKAYNRIDGVTSLVTICDLIPAHFPAQFSEQSAQDIINECYAADHILTISNYVRLDILRRTNLYSSEISVIYPPIANSTPAQKKIKTQPANIITNNYVIYPAAGRQHKNHRNLFLAAKSIDCEILLTTGEAHGTQRFRDLEQLANNLDVSHRVKLLGHLHDDEFQNLCNQSTALVFPSLAEGFGYPIVEAMTLGLPIACSYTSCIPEVARDLAVYFDPYNPDDIARTVNSIVQKKRSRSNLKKRYLRAIQDYAPTKSAQQLCELYVKLAHRNSLEKIRSKRNSRIKNRCATKHINLEIPILKPNYVQSMCVLLDCSRLFDGNLNSGIRRYIDGLISGLMAHSQIAIIPFFNPEARGYKGHHHDKSQTALVNRTLIDVHPVQKALLLAKQCYRNIVYHSPFHPLPRNRDAALTYCITLHDIIHLRRPDLYPHGQKSITKDIVDSISEADEVICDSRFTARELVDHKPMHFNITVSHLAASPFFGEDEDPPVFSHQLRDDAIVVMHQSDPRKNFGFMLDCVAVYAEKHVGTCKFTIISSDISNVTREEFMRLDRIQKLIDTTILESPTDEEMAELFDRSLCFLYLSLEEGFGLPPLEAISRGCLPIIAKNSALAEVYKGWPFLVDDGAEADTVANVIEDMRRRPAKALTKAIADILSRYNSSDSLNDHIAAYFEALRRKNTT